MPESWCSLSLSTVWGHSEKEAIYKPGRWFSSGTKQANTLNVDFPTSRTEETNSFCFKLPSLYYFVMAVIEQTKQTSINLKGEKSYSVATDYNEMILEIISMEKLGKLRNMWNLNRILLNNQWVKGEIKKNQKILWDECKWTHNVLKCIEFS